MQDTIHIGLAIDQNFGTYAGVTITSLVHNHIRNHLIIHIIYDELLPEDMDRLRLTEALYRNLTIHFYQLTDMSDMTFVVPPGHITQAMYYRYLFAELLPPSIQRIIYMDSDIICKGSLLPLWQTDLQGYVLGAIRDWGEEKSCTRIGLTSGRYFNSGVLLIDLDQWRRLSLTTRLFDWLQSDSKPEIIWGDQDALNGILDGEFLELPKLYNCIVINDTVLRAADADVIVHYIDCVKPWHSYYVDCPEKELYWHYVRKSLWDDMQPRDGHTVQTVAITARLLHQQGKYAESASYYEAILKYFMKDEYK